MALDKRRKSVQDKSKDSNSDNDTTEHDESSESDEEETKFKNVSSTQILANRISKEHEMELMQRIWDCIPKNDSIPFEEQLIKINWSKISFRNYSTKDVKLYFEEKLNHVRTYRLLSEILKDIENNIRSSTDDLSEMSKTNEFAVENEKKQQIQVIEAPESPEKSIVSSKKRKKDSKESVSDKKGQKKQKTSEIMKESPLHLYITAQKESGENKSVNDFRKQYSELDKKQKLKLILKCLGVKKNEKLNLNQILTAKELLTKNEMAIIEEYENCPKVLSAYQQYIKDYFANADKENIPHKELFKESIAKWNSLSDEEKAKITLKAKEMKKQYDEDFKKFLESLPEDRRIYELENHKTRKSKKVSKTGKKLDKSIDPPSLEEQSKQELNLLKSNGNKSGSKNERTSSGSSESEDENEVTKTNNVTAVNLELEKDKKIKKNSKKGKLEESIIGNSPVKGNSKKLKTELNLLKSKGNKSASKNESFSFGSSESDVEKDVTKSRKTSESLQLEKHKKGKLEESNIGNSPVKENSKISNKPKQELNLLKSNSKISTTKNERTSSYSSQSDDENKVIKTNSITSGNLHVEKPKKITKNSKKGKIEESITGNSPVKANSKKLKPELNLLKSNGNKSASKKERTSSNSSESHVEKDVTKSNNITSEIRQLEKPKKTKINSKKGKLEENITRSSPIKENSKSSNKPKQELDLLKSKSKISASKNESSSSDSSQSDHENEVKKFNILTSGNLHVEKPKKITKNSKKGKIEKSITTNSSVKGNSKKPKQELSLLKLNSKISASKNESSSSDSSKSDVEKEVTKSSKTSEGLELEKRTKNPKKDDSMTSDSSVGGNSTDSNKAKKDINVIKSNGNKSASRKERSTSSSSESDNESQNKRRRNRSTSNDSSPAQTPLRKKSKISSPKKHPGVFPKTVYKYFVANIYNGPEQRARAAYKALNSKQKKLYEIQYSEAQKKYLTSFEEYAKSLSPEEFKKFISNFQADAGDSTESDSD